MKKTGGFQIPAVFSQSRRIDFISNKIWRFVYPQITQIFADFSLENF